MLSIKSTMLKLSFHRLLVRIAGLLFLAGCSGGGGGSSPEDTNFLQGDGTALVSWTLPTENDDGSLLTDLEGFRIYYGIASGKYFRVVIIDDPTRVSHLVEGLGNANWHFAVIAYKSSGLQSEFSREVIKTISEN